MSGRLSIMEGFVVIVDFTTCKYDQRSQILKVSYQQ